MAWLRYEHFLGKSVTAFSSDASLDFLRGVPFPSGEAGRFVMTSVQQNMLDAVGVHDGVVFPKQVHGDHIWDVTEKDLPRASVFEADAVVTCVPGLAVAVRTADCLPLLMYSAAQRVVAAVHAGWKSTHLDIAAKAVAFMNRKYGVVPAQVRAVIGPCIRPASYPVGEEFRGYFPQEVTEKAGCYYFDIAAANRRQLLSIGVREENIFDCGCDSYADRSWHSFRRDGEASGRMIHAILMKKG